MIKERCCQKNCSFAIDRDKQPCRKIGKLRQPTQRNRQILTEGFHAAMLLFSATQIMSSISR